MTKWSPAVPKMVNPLVSLNLFGKLGENGVPGMLPNLNKVVYYQYLSEVPFWKSGPKSGP